MNWNDICEAIYFISKKGYKVDVIGTRLILILEGKELNEFGSAEELLNFVNED